MANAYCVVLKIGGYGILYGMGNRRLKPIVWHGK